MNNRFKILVVASLLNLFSAMAFNEVYAATTPHDLGAVIPRTGVSYMISDAKLNGINMKVSSSYVYTSIDAYYYDGDEQVFLTDYIGDNNSFPIEYELITVGTGANVTQRVKTLVVNSGKIPQEWWGKTVCVNVAFRSGANIHTFYFDVLGQPNVENTALGLTEIDANESYSKNLCKNDLLDISYKEVEPSDYHPYTFDKSHYDQVYEHTYTAEYVLSVFNVDTYERVEFIRNFTSMSTDKYSHYVEGASDNSRSACYQFELGVLYFKDGASDPVGSGEFLESNVVSVNSDGMSYYVQYDEPLSFVTLFNSETFKNSVSVCENDSKVFAVELTKGKDKTSGLPINYDNASVSLYYIDDSNNEVWVNTINAFEDYPEFDLSDILKVKDNKNTTYKFKVYAEDQNWQYAEPSGCISESSIFEITVVEQSVDVKLELDKSSVCENGDVIINGTVTGGSEYNYQWYKNEVKLLGQTNPYYFSDTNVDYNGGANVYKLAVIQTTDTKAMCPVYFEQSVEMYERPVLTAAVPSVEVCSDEYVEFSVTSSQKYVDVTWSPADGVETVSSDGLKYTYKVKGTTNGKVYTVTAVNPATGCDTKVPVTISVIVNEPPVIDYVSGAENPLCEGESTSLKPTSVSGSTATPYIYHWAWIEGGKAKDASTKSNDANGGALTFKPADDIPAAGAVYHVTVYATDDKKCSNKGNEYEFDVTYKPKPEFTVTPNDGCSNGDATLTMEPLAGYSGLSYAVSPVGGAPAGTISGNVYTVNQNVSSVQTYKYSVVASLGGCESDPIEASVKVYPLPVVTLVPDKSEYCLGETVNLTANASGVTFEWEGLAGDKSTNSDVPTSAGTKTYKVKVKSTTAPYCENEATATVYINSLPSVTLTASPNPICEGQSSTLTATATGGSGVYTYTWTGVSSSTNTASVSPVVDTGYKVKVTDDKQCPSEVEASVKVVVNKKPAFVAVPDREVCYNSKDDVVINVDVTSGTASFITLQGGERKAVVDNKVSFTVNQTWTTNPTEFVFTAESATCNFNDETDKVKASVVVNTKPDAPVVPTPDDVCDGKPVTMTVTSPNASYIYKWYSDSSCTNEVNVGTSYTIGSLSTGSVTYYVISLLGYCESDVTSVTVTAVDYPEKPVIKTASATMCSNDSEMGVTLEVDSPLPGLTYTWYEVASPKDNEVTMPVKPSKTTSYYVVATNATGCASEKSELVTLTINTSPSIDLGPVAASYCQYDKVVLSVEATGSNLEYHWSVNETDNLANDQISFEASTAGANTVSVYVVDTETLCQSEVKDFDFTVTAAPTYTISPADRDVCDGEPITLDIKTDAADPDIWLGTKDSDCPDCEYNWNASGLGLIGSSPNVSKKIYPEANLDYGIKILDYATMCSVEENFYLSVFSNPKVTVEGDQIVCVGNNLSVKLVPNDGATYSYTWKKDGTTWSSSDELSNDDVTKDYNGTYVVEIKNDKGCTAEKTVEVTVNDFAHTTIEGEDFVCFGSTMSLEAASKDMVSYSWTAEVDGSVVATSNTDKFDYDASKLAVGKVIKVTLDYTDEKCIGETQTKSVTVRELPIISSVDNLLYCLADGGELNLTANLQNPVSGSTYKYFWSHGALNKETSTNVCNVDVDLANEGTWSVYAVEYIGDKLICSGVAVPFNVDIREFTINDVVASNKEFCVGTHVEDPFVVDVNLTSDDDASKFIYDYVLRDESNNVVDQVLASDLNKYTLASIASYNSGVYTLTVNVMYKDLTLCSKSKTTQFTIFDLPSNSLNVSSHTPTSGDKYEPCDGDIFKFEVSAATSYKLFVDNVEVTDLEGSGFTQSENVYTYSSEYPASHDIYVEVGDAHCFNKTKTITVAYRAPIKVNQTIDATTTELVGDLVQICEGDKVTLDFSMEGNASNVVLELDGAAAGNNSIIVNAQALGGATSLEQTVVATIGGCERTVVVRTVQAPHTVIDLSSTKICSDEDMSITISGAQTYDITVSRDGVVLTGDEAAKFNSAVTSNTLSYIDNSSTYTGDRADYNEYSISVVGHVGTCQDDAPVVKSFYVYKNPSVDLSASSSLVISGTEVTFTATAGYESYEFFVNDASQVVKTGAENNLYKIVMNESNTVDNVAVIKVIATTYYGCIDEAEIKVSILEGIAGKDIVVSNDYYCSIENGVAVSVVDPQVGVTYVLNECASCAPITAVEGKPVEWDEIKVLDGETTSVYSVSAYHESLPGEVFPMNNTVNVTVMKSPTKFTIIPNRTDNRCDAAAEIKLDNSELGVYYQLYFNGVELGAELAGTGAELGFGLIADQVGVYTIKAYSKYTDGVGNISTTCPVTMKGQYEIDVPEAAMFTIESDPANGNFCADGDVVSISLSGSEFGKEYKLLRDGEVVKRGGEEVVVAGTGIRIEFGDFDVEGRYTVVCHYDGCSTLMDDGDVDHVDLKMWNRPSEQVVTLSNYGHYCSDDNGAVVTVEGQEQGYEYSLMKNGEVFVGSDNIPYVHIGDATGDPFTWSDIVEGTYTISIRIPVVESGCETILAPFTIVKDNSPVEALIAIIDANGAEADEATLCENEETEIVLYNTQKDVEYTLMLDGTVINTIIDASDIHSFRFTGIKDAGVYTIRATKKYEADGVDIFCDKLFEKELVLNYVPRPTGSATLGHEVPAGADECYGEDIVVNDATPGFIYQIYRVDGANEFLMKEYTFTATGNSIDDRFRNIKTNYGKFHVYVSNGFCEDPIDYIELVNTKFVSPQTVVGMSSMCQGDEGQTIGLAGAEDGVEYRLYGPGITGFIKHVAVGTDAFVFEDHLMNQDGTYYIMGVGATGCEVKMYPEIEFAVNPLPISFHLDGYSKYCSPDGNELTLSGSETGVYYTLYSKAADGVLNPIQTIIGGGHELIFEPVTAGTYVAAARNIATECTSSMLGEVTLSENASILSLDDLVDIKSCTAKNIVFNDKLVAGVTYYLVKGTDSPENGFVSSVACDGSSINFTLDEAGNYTIYGAYEPDFSCLTVYADVHFTIEPIKTQKVVAEDNCNGSVTIRLLGSEVGVSYVVKGYEKYSGLFDGDNRIWTLPVAGGEEKFTVIGILDACESVVGEITKTVLTDKGTRLINIVSCADENGTLVLNGSELFNGATYYLVRGESEPVNGSLEMHRYIGSDLSFTLDEVGTYSVYASLNNECYMKVYDVVFSTRKVNSHYVVSGEVTCEGGIYIKLDGSQTGIEYSINVADAQPILGNGNAIKWFLDNRPTSVVSVTANVGDCHTVIGSLGVNDFTSETFENVNVSVVNNCSTNTNIFTVDNPQEGVTYTLYVNGVAQTTGTNWTIVNDAKSTYRVDASNDSGCDPFMVYYDVIDNSDVKSLPVSDITSCEETYPLVISMGLEKDVTYYLVSAGVTTPTSTSQEQYTDGSVSVQFLLSDEGYYDIIATRGNGCYNTVGSFKFAKTVIDTKVKIDALVDCSGNAKIVIDPQDGVSYKVDNIDDDGSHVWTSVDRYSSHIILATYDNCDASISVQPSEFKSENDRFEGSIFALGGCSGAISVSLTNYDSSLEYTLIEDGVESVEPVSNGSWFLSTTGEHTYSVKVYDPVSGCEFIHNSITASSTAELSPIAYRVYSDEDVELTDALPSCKVYKIVLDPSTLVKNATYYLYSRKNGIDTKVELKNNPFKYNGDGNERSFVGFTPNIGTLVIVAELGDCQDETVISNEIVDLSDVVVVQNMGGNCDNIELSINGGPIDGVSYFLDGIVLPSDTKKWVVNTVGNHTLTLEKDGCTYSENINVSLSSKPEVRLETVVDNKTYTSVSTPTVCKTSDVRLVVYSDASDVEYIFTVNGDVQDPQTSSEFILDLNNYNDLVTVSVIARSTNTGCTSDEAVADVIVNSLDDNFVVYFADIDENGEIIKATRNDAIGTIDDENGRVVVENVISGVTYTLIHKGTPVYDPIVAINDNDTLFFGPVYSDVVSYANHGIGDYYVQATKADCNALSSPITYTELSVAVISKTVSFDCETGSSTVTVDNPKSGWTYTLKFVDSQITVNSIKPIQYDGVNPVTWIVSEPSGLNQMIINASRGNSEMTTDPFDVMVNPTINTNLVMLHNGVEVVGDDLEICMSPNVLVWFYGVTNNADIKSYDYRMYKLTNNVEVLVDSAINRSPAFIYKPSKYTYGDTIVVKISTELSSGCRYTDLAQRSFKVKSSVTADNRLYTKTDNDNQYCEGDFGLTLAFKDVEKGSTYRLWKYTDPYRIVEDLQEINRDSVDLVDVQELPEYYGSEHASEIVFNGWSFNTPGLNDFASNGFYYVTIEDAQGCASTSNIVEVIENPLPYGEKDENVDTCSVYFAAGSYVNGIIVTADDTKNSEYGLLDDGFMVFENAHVGYKYELVHIAGLKGEDCVLQTIDDVTEGQTLYFGPIASEMYRQVNNVVDGVVVSTDTVNVMGIGEYTIRVTDMTRKTNCQNDIGYLTFIDEELITYDVFISLNSDDSSRRVKLIPGYGHKGNHKYLDWSTAIDKVYVPDQVETAPDGSSTIIGDTQVEKYGSETGYSSLRGDLTKNANIVFALQDQLTKKYVNADEEGAILATDTITILDNFEKGCNVDTTYTKRILDSYEAGCDSSYVSTGYEYFKVLSDGTKIKISQSDVPNYLGDPNVKVDSVNIGSYQYYVKDPVYKYWKNVYYKIEDEFDSRKGSFGFDDYDGTIDLLKESMTGEFVYRKVSGFYGEVKIPYYAYNAKMKNLRTSNTSYITILCGNESIPGDSTNFLLPNVISPNGDGYNDEYKVLLPPAYEENHTSKLEIFNRWGTLVYRSSGKRYGRDCPNWDGTSKTSNMLTLGEKLPQGTYFYIFTIDFNIDGKIRTRKLSGYVELRR